MRHAPDWRIECPLLPLSLMQWYLDPQGMRLPPPVVPEDCPPAARLIMDTLVVSPSACTCMHHLRGCI